MIQRNLRLIGVALMAIFAGGLFAQAQGDFAPRGSLAYVRANDVSGALKGLFGDEWRKHADEVLALMSEGDRRELGGVDEAWRFIDYLGETELVIVDVMVREPYIQLIEVTRLKEGAPTEFSEEFLKSLNEDKAKRKQSEYTPSMLRHRGDLTIRLHNGLMITTVGGTAEAHVKEVLAGKTDESLSKVKKFQKWNETAHGDIVGYADMAAWRAALDRLGEDFDNELRASLDFMEWQKWDRIELSVTLPGNTSRLEINANLITNEPLKRPAVFFRPGGAPRLVGLLPSETVAVASIQLGSDHEKTYLDVLGVIHDVLQQTEPANLKRRIERYETQIEQIEKEIARLEKDEDLDEARRKQDIDASRNRIAMHREMIARWNDELGAYKERPFNPNNETGERKGRTEPERFHDELSEILKQFGITRGEIASALGTEAVIGIIDLPDNAPERANLDYYEDHWFVAAEVTAEFDTVKNKLLDTVLARKLPEDMPEKERERALKNAANLVCYDVPGGEILCERRIRQEVVFFAGSGIAGAAPNDIVARRLLASASGQGRFDTNKLGGVVGSKLGWVDLRAVGERLLQATETQSSYQGRFPRPGFDLRAAFEGGAMISAATDERGNGISLRVTFGGTPNFAGLLPMFRDELVAQQAQEHDESQLRSIAEAARRWKSANEVALPQSAAERRAAFRAVTLENLVEQNHLKPRDGLRSAFDPAAVRKAGDPADLSECGFDFYGPYADSWPAGERDPDVTESKGMYMGRVPPLRGWIVAAHKKPWARGGRYVMLEYHTDIRKAWLSESDFQKLLAVNGRGDTELAAIDRVSAQPEWKRRKELGRHEWELRNIRQELTQRREAAISSGGEFNPEFDGGTDEELRELLGDGRNVRISFPSSRLKFWTTEAGVFVRETDGDLWIQQGPKGASASWMRE
jgi:hypothetical protein